MQVLLAILIAAAASEVQSAGFACSNCPMLSNLYSLAQKIVGFEIPEAPGSSSGENLHQRMNDKIIHFMKQYEVAETEVDCKYVLCNQKLQFLMDLDPSATVPSVFEEYDVLHENYVEQLGRGVYNLSSEYCQAADKKLQEISNLAGTLFNKLGTFVSVEANYDPYFRDFYYSILNIRYQFDGADRSNCRYLNPEFLNCVGRAFSEDYFKKLPQELQNHVDYFLEHCNKIKHELESMKGPGIECE